MSGPSKQDWSVGLESEEVFRLLFEGYFQPVRNYFGRRGVSTEDALDLTQEVFLRAYRGLGNFRRDAQHGTWLFTIARHVWVTRLRGQSAIKRDGALVSLDQDRETGANGAGGRAQVATADPDPLELVLSDERGRQLREALEQLPPQMRRCVMLRLYQGLKYREIAMVMRISIQTVKTHIFHARRRLASALEEYSDDLDL